MINGIKGDGTIIVPNKIVFYSCDLKFNPMTLVFELSLDIIKTYVHAQLGFPGQIIQKLSQNITFRHKQEVNI